MIELTIKLKLGYKQTLQITAILLMLFGG